ncbi:MAG: aminotransferase class V-fold PLP-dependent enzyme, partial [Cyanobacteria bacterium J06555_12]
MGDLDPSLYFDHSATTPPRPEVLAAFQKAATEAWGNPSSLHSWGQRAAIAVEIARQQVATLIGAAPERVVFTSGGTESDNLAIVG